MAHEPSQVADQVADIAGLLTMDELLSRYWHEEGGDGRLPIKDLGVEDLKEIARTAVRYPSRPNRKTFYLLREDQHTYKDGEPIACPNLILRMVRYVLEQRGEDISDMPQPVE